MDELEEFVEFVDLSACLARHEAPIKIMRRGAAEDWYVRLPAGQAHAWGVNRSGEFFRIPLIAHRSRSRDPAELLAGMMRTAWKYGHELAAFGEVRAVHWIVGRQVEDLPEENVFRVWVGFAACLK